jgi:hypothetical protein
VLSQIGAFRALAEVHVGDFNSRVVTLATQDGGAHILPDSTILAPPGGELALANDIPAHET